MSQAVNDALVEHEGRQEVEDGVGAVWLSREVAYGVERLLKGLLSSHGAARQGFASVLTELLQQHDVLDTPTFLARLDAETRIQSGMDDKDRREAFLGKLFGVLVLLRSGRLDALPSQDVHVHPSAAMSRLTCMHMLLDVLEYVGYVQEMAVRALFLCLRAVRRYASGCHEAWWLCLACDMACVVPFLMLM